ncbi:hypothetical protein Brsp04_04521 [Brucella sp. NBRC 12952]
MGIYGDIWDLTAHGLCNPDSRDDGELGDSALRSPWPSGDCEIAFLQTIPKRLACGLL